MHGSARAIPDDGLATLIFSCDVVHFLALEDERMHAPQRLDQAFDRCHDAVFGMSSWDSALQLLAEALGAESCVFKPRKSPVVNGLPLQLESSEHRPFSELWLEHIDGAPDPHIDRPSLVSVDRYPCVIEHQITTDEERRRMPYFNEIARRGNRVWWASLRFDVMGAIWALPLYRGEKLGAFDLEEAAFLRSQIKRVRSLVVARQAMEGRAAATGIRALDGLGVPAFLFNREGHVVAHNAALDRCLGDWLAIRRGRLGASDPASDRDLRAFLRRAVLGPVDPVVIRRNDVPWLAVSALSLGEASSELFSGATGVAFFRDLSPGDLPDTGILQVAFGLTPAETRLARRVATGSGLVEACRHLQISHETGKSHLKAIFAKTRTTRQAELAALLNRFL
jgi:DNA-binding CsgD family transcriptional regulator